MNWEILVFKKRPPLTTHRMTILRNIVSGFLVVISTFPLTSCSHHDPLRPHQIPITSPLAKDSIAGDTSIIMARSGIDFPVLLQAASTGQPEALRLVFWCSHNIGLDGAGADGYGTYLLKVGDQKVFNAIRDLDRKTLGSIKSHLLNACGFHSPDQEVRARAEPKLKELFPKSWERIRTND